MMATLNVHEAMGAKVDRESVAELVLPQLWSMSMGPLLSVDQFQRFMAVIKTLGSRVEREHVEHLRAVRGAEAQTSVSAPISANGGWNHLDEPEVDFATLVKSGGLGPSIASPAPASNGLGDDFWASTADWTSPAAAASSSALVSLHCRSFFTRADLGIDHIHAVSLHTVSSATNAIDRIDAHHILFVVTPQSATDPAFKLQCGSLPSHSCPRAAIERQWLDAEYGGAHASKCSSDPCGNAVEQTKLQPFPRTTAAASTCHVHDTQHADSNTSGATSAVDGKQCLTAYQNASMASLRQSIQCGLVRL